MGSFYTNQKSVNLSKYSIMSKQNIKQNKKSEQLDLVNFPNSPKFFVQKKNKKKTLEVEM